MKLVVGKHNMLCVSGEGFRIGDLIEIEGVPILKYRPTADDVAKVRGESGASIVDCAFALGMCSGDIEKTVLFLREMGY